jgi:signal transduction histidine kinase
VTSPSVAPRPSGTQPLKLALFLGGSLLAVTVFVLAHWAIDRLTREVATTSRVLAGFCAQASFPATQDTALRMVVGDLIRQIDFPIVVTDAEGLPRAWKGIDVDPRLISAESIDSVDVGDPVSPVTQANIERVRRAVERLDRRYEPIQMTRYGLLEASSLSGPQFGIDTLGAVHYGDPHVLEVLRWTPYVSVVGTLLLLLMGYSGLRAIRDSEKRTIWVGMAKETAHQLGTPLSSLMGWAESLRGWMPEGAPSGAGDGSVSVPAEDLKEITVEIERDIDRLRKVAQRFSNVGSEPVLQEQDPRGVVRDVVGYMRPRVPRSGRSVELRERYDEIGAARLNPELLEWAVENLVSNALSALDKPTGWVEVAVRPSPDRRFVEITVSDNGRGMNPREQRRAFEPGYTTKRRGWGLGLALARRVVEDYHGGRIEIARSAPGEGTTILIRLPATPPKDATPPGQSVVS